MSRDDQAVYEEIKVKIAFVIREVAKEDTPGGPRGEFVRRGGGSVRVTRGAEDMQMFVRWSRAKKGEVRTGSLNRLQRKTVQ
jgi:hypothetical protein